MEINIEFQFTSEPESEELKTARLDFLDWLNTQRRKSQNAVRALFPQLKQGIPVHKIEEAVEEALHWKSIPDEWSHSWAEDYVERRAFYDALAEIGETNVFEFWIDVKFYERGFYDLLSENEQT